MNGEALMNTKIIKTGNMNNKIKTILFLCIFCINYTYATHNQAAYITCQHLTGFTYKISLVTYTKADSQADRCELTIRYNTGDSCVAIRSNGPIGNCTPPAKDGENIGNYKKKNIYECIYTFPNQNIYTIYFSDPNRNADINNIPNSLQLPYYVETKLYVFDPNNFCISNSIGFANIPIDEAIVNTKYESDTPIAFSDGDSLTYQLTACMVNGADIPLYTIPNDMTINLRTGRITWLQPSQLGQWSFAVLVKKWRQNILVGTSIVDYTITVVSAPYTPQNVTVNTNCILNTDSTYSCTINPNDSIQILLTNPNSTINYYSEIDTNYTYTTNNDTNIFKWYPTTINARHNPYKITFRHLKQFPIQNQYKDITFFITVNDTSNQPCPIPPNLSTIKTIKENNTFTIYPNPTTDILNINYTLPTNGNTNIQIINSQGQIVKEITQQKTTGNQTTTLDTKQFAKGLYYVRFNEGGNSKQSKIIIQ